MQFSTISPAPRSWTSRTQSSVRRSAAREHFADVFNRARVDGALAASVFHSAAIEIGELKRYLATAGIAIRPVN